MKVLRKLALSHRIIVGSVSAIVVLFLLGAILLIKINHSQIAIKKILDKPLKVNHSIGNIYQIFPELTNGYNALQKAKNQHEFDSCFSVLIEISALANHEFEIIYKVYPNKSIVDSAYYVYAEMDNLINQSTFSDSMVNRNINSKSDTVTDSIKRALFTRLKSISEKSINEANTIYANSTSLNRRYNIATISLIILIIVIIIIASTYSIHGLKNTYRQLLSKLNLMKDRMENSDKMDNESREEAMTNLLELIKWINDECSPLEDENAQALTISKVCKTNENNESSTFNGKSYIHKNEELKSYITKLQSVNTQLQISKKKAEENDNLKTAFLANMSHEIRTPLNGIIGFSNLLLQGSLSKEKKAKYIKIIKTSGENLLRIINDILDLSKMEVHQLELIYNKVKVKKLLSEIQILFEARAISMKKDNVKITVNDLSNDVEMSIDEMRLKQVLGNLIENALKFTFKGEIQLGAELVDTHNILFWVKDTGQGIPKDIKDIIFNRFTKANDRQSNSAGTGLGLAICKNLVELMGGDIKVESKIGKGSKFYFTIPLEHKEHNNNNMPQKKMSLETNKSILVVEDDPFSKLYLDEILRSYNINFTALEKGDKVLPLLKKEKFDIILLDIQLPDMNGLDLVGDIRKLNKNVIIIAQTAYAMSNDYDRCIKAGCDDYISKPINVDELVRILSKYV